MTPLPRGWRRFTRIWRRAPEREVDAEVTFHLDERTAELIATGMDADHARMQAEREFGDVSAVRKRLVTIDTGVARRRSVTEQFEWLLQDVRYVARTLRRAPGFVIMVSLTLALGLGANAAIFSLLDRLFLRPPAGVNNPELIRRIYRLDSAVALKRVSFDGAPPSSIETTSVFSHSDYENVAKALPAGVRLGGYSIDRLKLGRGEGAIDLKVQFVLGDYFSVLGVSPQLGRVIAGEEARIVPTNQVVVISDALWRSRFAASREIVGQTAVIQYRPYTIIGVTPPDFRGPDNDAADVWLPMSTEQWRRGGRPDWYSGDNNAWIRMLARLDGKGAATALELAAAGAFRASTIMPDSLATSRLAPLTEAGIAGFGNKEVTIATRLAGVAVIILLIACANVANLLLSRGLRRRREIAMRLALGVSRRRLVSLLVMESVTVAMTGAAIALVVAIWGARALREQLMPDTHFVGAAVDIRVLLFTVVLALLTGLIAGIVPALRSSRPDLAVALRGSARDGVFQRSRVSAALLISQAALSVVLLAGAGLFVRSLRSVQTENIGYDADRVVFASVDVDPDQSARRGDVTQRIPRLEERLRLVPGVESTALTMIAPFEGFSMEDVAMPGADSLPHVPALGPFTSYVSPTFFGAMGIRLTRGRGLSVTDRYADGLSMVVNETMARSYWPGREPIGQCLLLNKPSQKCTAVVGVVSDAHFNGIIEKPSMHFYLPAPDSGRRRPGVIVLRAAPGQAAAVAERTRRILRAEFAGWAEPAVRPMTANMQRELRSWRTGATLFAAAGVLALLVAIVGVYSTISYTFSQRTHEIGVRVALGARASSVVRLVVGAGVKVVAIGIVLGLAIALAAGKLVASMLYRTSPRDPMVLATVSITLLLVAVGACLVPAWRALRVDPATALRAE